MSKLEDKSKTKNNKSNVDGSSDLFVAVEKWLGTQGGVLIRSSIDKDFIIVYVDEIDGLVKALNVAKQKLSR